MLKLSQALSAWQPAQHRAAHDPVVLLEAGWQEIVGAQVARNSHPAAIAGGTLVVVTRSGAWSQQLSFLSEHVVRAVAARLPAAGVQRLRLRVGRLPVRRPAAAPRQRAGAPKTAPERPSPSTAGEALARFRSDVERGSTERAAAGWIACRRCGALAVRGGGALCAACSAARGQELAARTARLLCDAPWLGYGGTAALVEGLQEEEYERVRSRLLAHWWNVLARARTARRPSPDGRERLVAGAYVLLRSGLPPEEIAPATVRNILGDELHDLLYGNPAPQGGAVTDKKRKA